MGLWFFNYLDIELESQARSKFQVVFVICHRGQTLTSGHYTIALRVPGSLMQASAQCKRHGNIELKCFAGLVKSE